MSFGQPNYNIFNPPDYWTQMITDPTQVPVQLYPYGGGGPSPYGPYPGFYFGARTMTYDDAMRHARERQKAEEYRAETTSDPVYKYISPEGKLNPEARAVYLQAKKMVTPKHEDPVKKLQKRIVASVLIGAVLSALLK